MTFEWTEDLEDLARTLRTVIPPMSYAGIAELLGCSPNAVKHKVRRLQQFSNLDKYKHTAEKLALLQGTLSASSGLKILETHAGFGGMTEHYQKLGKVLSLELDARKVEELKAKGFDVIKCNSEHEVLRLVYERQRFDIVDIDPYGLPSRYFPHIFNLLDDGILYLTFPMVGVAQINKITIQHYLHFWRLDIGNYADYTSHIFRELKSYAFMCKRSLELLSVIKIDRVYRFAIRVEKQSLLKICDLKVNRRPKF